MQTSGIISYQCPLTSCLLQGPFEYFRGTQRGSDAFFPHYCYTFPGNHGSVTKCDLMVWLQEDASSSLSNVSVVLSPSAGVGRWENGPRGTHDSGLGLSSAHLSFCQWNRTWEFWGKANGKWFWSECSVISSRFTQLEPLNGSTYTK